MHNCTLTVLFKHFANTKRLRYDDVIGQIDEYWSLIGQLWHRARLGPEWVRGETQSTPMVRDWSNAGWMLWEIPVVCDQLEFKGLREINTFEQQVMWIFCMWINQGPAGIYMSETLVIFISWQIEPPPSSRSSGEGLKYKYTVQIRKPNLVKLLSDWFYDVDDFDRTFFTDEFNWLGISLVLWHFSLSVGYQHGTSAQQCW